MWYTKDMAKKIFVEIETETTETDQQASREEALAALPYPAAWVATFGINADTYWAEEASWQGRLTACERDNE